MIEGLVFHKRDWSSHGTGLKAASSRMRHSNGMRLTARELAANWLDGKYIKSHGRSLANDSGSVVRRLNPKHVKGREMQAQIQSLPGTMAEADDCSSFLWMEGYVWEPAWSPSPSPQQCKMPALAANVSASSPWNTIYTFSQGLWDHLYLSPPVSSKRLHPVPQFNIRWIEAPLRLHPVPKFHLWNRYGHLPWLGTEL